MIKEHSHYFKPTKGIEYIDVYWILSAFNVTDPTLQHSIKKLLCAGIRGGGKGFEKDVQEAIDTLHRGQELRAGKTPPINKDLDTGKETPVPRKNFAPEVPPVPYVFKDVNWPSVPPMHLDCGGLRWASISAPPPTCNWSDRNPI